jgi:hypothetical protein
MLIEYTNISTQLDIVGNYLLPPLLPGKHTFHGNVLKPAKFVELERKASDYRYNTILFICIGNEHGKVATN